MRLERIIFFSDVHIPYHDKAALKILLDVIKDFQPSILVNNGDFIDCAAVSRHSKNLEQRRSFRKELEIANGVLDQMDALVPKARKIFLEGNHEQRLPRYIDEKCPELEGLISIKEKLRLAERGWKHVAYKDDIQIGKVFVTHDVGSAGRYNAFKCLDTYAASIVTGHTHRLSYIVEGDATGGRKVSAQFGWLGDVNQIDYLHRVKARREWTTGFGYGYINPKTGYVYLIPVPIVKGTVVVEGKLYGVGAR